jgi:mRNA-degrading endonuclease RelE of RelBE toxin-antitoxin system
MSDVKESLAAYNTRLLFATPTHFGYTLARMRYEIILAPEALRDLNRLKAHMRATVRDALEQYLRHEPAKISKSRIKRLRGLTRPQFRLRVDDIRVFYDVSAGAVEVLAIVSKADAEAWLAQIGDSDEENTTV